MDLHLQCRRCERSFLAARIEVHVEQCEKDNPDCVICGEAMMGGGEVDEWGQDFHEKCLAEVRMDDWDAEGKWGWERRENFR